MELQCGGGDESSGPRTPISNEPSARVRAESLPPQVMFPETSP